MYVICNANEIFFFAVNLSGVGRVDMSHFDLLKVLGTGGKLFLFYYFFVICSLQLNEIILLLYYVDGFDKRGLFLGHSIFRLLSK